MFTATTSFDQLSQAFGQHERGRPHFHHLNLTSGDEQVQRAAAEAGESTGIGHPHADWLD
jgi:hypothetical protein